MKRISISLILLTATQAAQAAPALPTGLAGSWFFGSLGNIAYQDVQTREWQNASSAGELVVIKPDGTYQRTRVLVMTTYSCTSRLRITEKGRVSVTGDQLRYQPTSGVNEGYTCTPSNAWRSTKINPETYTLTLSRDGQGRSMTLRGKESEYKYQPFQASR